MSLGYEGQVETWIAEIAEGKCSAFEQLYKATLPKVLLFAARILLDDDAAQDCVAETYVRIWRDAPKYSPQRGSGMAWICTICRSQALNMLQSCRRHDRIEEAVHLNAERQVDDASLDVMSQFDICSTLNSLLLGISKEQKMLIELAFCQELSHSEIAQVTGMPIGTVKSYIHRALSSMRTQLGATTASVRMRFADELFGT